jgi:hypothetical protein
MGGFSVIRGLRIVLVSIIVAGMACSTSATSERSGKFGPASWPEETVHYPECWIVQTDGTLLPARRIECGW